MVWTANKGLFVYDCVIMTEGVRVYVHIPSLHPNYLKNYLLPWLLKPIKAMFTAFSFMANMTFYDINLNMFDDDHHHHHDDG